MNEGEQLRILRTDEEQRKSGGKSGPKCQILRKLGRGRHQGDRVAVRATILSSMRRDAVN
jgi:hypothetical protein